MKYLYKLIFLSIFMFVISLIYSNKISNKNKFSVFNPDNFIKPKRAKDDVDPSSGVISISSINEINTDSPNSTVVDPVINANTTDSQNSTVPTNTTDPVVPTNSTTPTNTTDPVVPTNSTHGPDVFNSNFDCPEGKVFDRFTGKCVELNGTETLYTNHTTSTKVVIQDPNMINPQVVGHLCNDTTDAYSKYQNVNSTRRLKK